MRCLFYLLIPLSCLHLATQAFAANHLPLSTSFIGQDKFYSMEKKAVKEKWGSLPMGARMSRVAKELEGTPYKSYTLDIAPSFRTTAEIATDSPDITSEALDSISP